MKLMQEGKRMIFYHYTSREALDSIMQEGLNQGEAPISEWRWVNAVNLTTDPEPEGHGLDMGGHVITPEEADRYARKGLDMPAGTAFVEKRAVRITIRLPSTDRKLKLWRTWSRKNCERAGPSGWSAPRADTSGPRRPRRGGSTSARSPRPPS
jgi:hypothetical protein